MLLGGKAPTGLGSSLGSSHVFSRGPRNHPRMFRDTTRTQALLASTKQSDAVTLPLNFYHLLRIAPTASRESASRAYTRCLEEAPSEGFSPQALAARATVLRSAMETLVNPAVRRSYDARLRQGEVAEEVPAEFVAGTLMLLQESGDAGTVVAAGEAWLATHRRSGSARDVALAVALAHYDLARAHLEAHGTVEQAVAMLQVSAKLLRQHRAGTPDLPRRIDSAMAELRPALALELVANPLENAAQRAEGLALLPAVLEAFSGNSPVGEARRGGLTRKHIQEHLRSSLTAAEHVALLAAAGDAYACTPAELYEAAMAHMADGAASAKPALIQTAAQLLERAEAAAAEAALAVEAPEGMLRDRRLMDERHRRAVAAGVCQLLLGSGDGAADALGLRGGPPKCDRQVLAFIKAHSPDYQDLLPGLCTLVQRWIADVALVAFRPPAAPPVFVLADWFEHPAVQRHLSTGGAHREGDWGLGAAVRGAGALLAAPFTALLGVLTQQRPAREVQEGAAEGEQQAKQFDEQQPDAEAVTAAPAQQPATAMFNRRKEESQRPSAAAASAPFAEADTSEQQRQLSPVGASARARAAPQAAASVAGVIPAGDFAAAPAKVEPYLSKGAESPANFLPVPVALEALKPLSSAAEDRWMRSAYEPRHVRWDRLVGAAALVAGGAFLAAKTALPGLLPASSPAAPSFASIAISEPPTAAAAVAAVGRSSAVPSRREAAAVVSRWQHIKAAALGSGHHADGLQAVLQGEVLQQWQERSAQLTAKGWHYDHDLQSSKVTAIAAGTAPGTAVVTAAFREGVTVHKGAAVEPQTFVSEYEVTYEMAQQQGGAGWVITAAHVQVA